MKEVKKKLSPQEKSFAIKKIAILGVMAAIAYTSTLITSPIKFFDFLSCDIKDAIIAIISFIFGPVSGLLVTLVVSLLETFTFSQTGPIGLAMNIISSACFVVPAALVYKYKRTLFGAVMGLILGSVVMTGAMLLWNYVVTPMYMGISREAVASMLPTVFLPFNLLKAGINSTLTLILYKAVVTALRKAKLIPKGENEDSTKKGTTVGVIAISCFVLLTCVLILLAYNGII